MQLSKYATLCTIAAVIRKHGKNYSYATQETYLELLLKHHKVKIGLRQLNYHLSDLRKEGYIKSHKRCGRKESGTIYLMSSAICLTIKGCLLLMNKGYAWAASHLAKLRKIFIPFFSKKAEQKIEALPLTAEIKPDTLQAKIDEAKAKGIGLYNLIRGITATQ